MIRGASVGYLQAPPALLESGEWHVLGVDGQLVELEGSAIKSWHYEMSLQIEHTVTAKLDDLRAACRLHPDDELRLVLSWRASTTGLQGRGRPITPNDGLNHLEMLINGIDAGGELELKTELTLGRASRRDRSPLLPVRPGSILWSDEFRIYLEGDASRFPTEALSFETMGIGRPGSAWRVDVDTDDLDAPALDRVRLTLNTDHEVYRLLNEAESPKAQATRSFLEYDVARQLVAAALTCDELRDDEDYTPGSVGDVLRQRIDGYFPFEPGGLSELRARWHDDPRAVECDLQASFL